MLKGTTTIGLTCSDGIVLVADKRASWGSFVASKDARKIFNINDVVGATVAGSVGDAEALMRVIRAEASLYEMNNKKKMSANAVASLLANILQGNKIFPYLVQLVIAGMDTDIRLFTLDPIGGLIEEKMASSGSGSPVAYGVLELQYSHEKSVDENIPVALRALKSAMARDTATGDGIGLATITKDGFKEYTKEEIDALMDGNNS
ncbi:MAG: archaeal proteasome endopeptidase complex subunit beta [Candidatus Altiarchaeota archaeon]|nr:archaeal proteasome endopeptidase complex subunit beta [Candidatus Altiarchaeota archaeon]MBU4266364.1 archaeal proteasome endopeptidase complex subunit beta [Candidatus Altiarchaeota archaeon]MBU4341173.1 archaeal proteasome endopeptidase complex subunit beta [Candidatus Altiarchaeota archaeon]MBU4406094.1 archaeal proteasome endopeptidase complex subunit beta [Candidatus Altiarchaeota archaeon]MBU4437529.1 archaeal proteasome endopeptidase complex subunit beta [Candidatus Altiarchaeota arc